MEKRDWREIATGTWFYDRIVPMKVSVFAKSASLASSRFMHKPGQHIPAKIGGIPTEAKVRAALDSTGGVKLVVDFRIRADRYDS